MEENQVSKSTEKDKLDTSSIEALESDPFSKTDVNDDLGRLHEKRTSIIEGKRERFPVKKLEVSIPQRHLISVKKGQGVILETIPNVLFNLEEHKGGDETLSIVHRLLFGTKGKKSEVKKHIRQFSGLIFDNEEEKMKYRSRLNNLMNAQLKSALHFFDLPVSGTKEELMERLFSFLLNPFVAKESKKTVKKRKSISPHNKHRQKKKNQKSSTYKEEEEADLEDEDQEEKGPESSKDEDYNEENAKRGKKNKRTMIGSLNFRKNTSSLDNEDGEDNNRVMNDLIQTNSSLENDSACAVSDMQSNELPSKEQIIEQLKKLLENLSDDMTPRIIRTSLEKHFGVDLSSFKKFINKKIRELIDFRS